MRKKAKKMQDEKKSEATHPKRKTTKKKINLQDKKALGLDPVSSNNFENFLKDKSGALLHFVKLRTNIGFSIV